MSTSERQEALERENSELRERLREAESVLDAIQHGQVDAVIVSNDGEDRVFTLQGADHPYRVLVESMSEGAATLNGDGVILYANPRLAELLAISRTDLMGTRISDWAEADDAALLAGMVRQSRGKPVSGEMKMRTKEGSTVPVHASLSPLFLEGEHFCCAIVTDQSLAEHHQALEEAARRIREANEQLRQADQRKDEFLATLAHELRNPLAPIRNAAHIIRLLEDGNVRLGQARQMIERQVTHMTRLVDDLLELSRITLGRLRLRKRTESLSAVLADVTEGARSGTRLQHELRVDIPADELPVNGDAVRLSQAISNVIENAVKYTPEGGIIDVRACREGDQAVVRIRDTGIGIGEKVLPRIFDMFEQGDGDDSRQSGGLGIGLALTRSIIELHGGTIEAASAGRGHGSEFVIRLPLDRPASADVQLTQEVVPAQMPQGVLIVDDNVDAAESLRVSLELSGHVAKAVHAGEAALDALNDFRPDLVLLDIGLPDIDGYEVARRLRQRWGAACPKLVALSGWGRSEDKQRATEAGIDDYLTKPVHPSVVARIVAENAAGKGGQPLLSPSPQARRSEG